MKKPNADIKLLADGVVELSIYGEIGEGWFDDGSVSARDVAAMLKEHAGASVINLRINSPGGSAIDGAAIHNLLTQHRARIEVDIDGMALSAASIVAMAGDEIRMAANALFMIHDPWTLSVGDASDLRSDADRLDKVALTIAQTYATRTGKDIDEVSAMMSAETWFTADEAAAAGFVDTVTDTKRIAATPAGHVLRRYRNAPQQLKAQASSVTINVSSAVDPQRVADQLRIAFDSGAAASANGPDGAIKSEEQEDMSKITQALNLPEDADEAAVVAAVGALTTRASLSTEFEAIAGATGPEGIGAIRAMAEKAEKADELQLRLEEVEGSKVADEFAAALKGAQEGDEKKLTPAMATFWQGRFDAADDKAALCSELQGYLKVASPVVHKNLDPPKDGNTGDAGAALMWNGKTYEDLSFPERAALLKAEPELGRAMKDDFDKRQG